MSIDALKWAMDQKLPAMQKIVLIMLANRINKNTCVCFPSLTRIAEDSGMTKMSVTRQIDKLETEGYLKVIRSVKNGEKQNNHYRLSMGSNRELLPSNTELLGGSITELLPSNTELLGVVTESYEGSNRELHKPQIEPINLTTTTTTTESGSGNFLDLIYPTQLSDQERQAASKLLTNCNGAAQSILDALSAAIQAKEIKKTPLSYLGGLVRRYQSGNFDDAGAISIADKRAKKADRDAEIQKQYVVSTEEVLKELAALRKPKLEPVLLADKILENTEEKARIHEKLISFRRGLKIR